MPVIVNGAFGTSFIDIKVKVKVNYYEKLKGKCHQGNIHLLVLVSMSLLISIQEAQTVDVLWPTNRQLKTRIMSGGILWCFEVSGF